jgi:transposase-like protein
MMRRGNSMAKQTRKRLKPEQKEEIKKLSAEGKTQAQIAEAIGCSVPTVGNVLRGAGVKKGKKGAGRPKGSAAKGGLGDVIRQLVKQEVAAQLKEAFASLKV